MKAMLKPSHLAYSFRHQGIDQRCLF